MPVNKFAFREKASLDSFFSAPLFETLEDRLLLSAPVFDTALSQGYWVPVPTGSSTYNTRVIGIDGSSDTTSITAAIVGSAPGLTVSVQNTATTDYADLHFVASDGTTVIGDIVFQLFDSNNVWADSDAAAQRFVDLATEAVSGGQLVAGTPFYTNLDVFRVIPGFMIQTGDAVDQNGTGSSGLGTLTDSFDPNLSFVGAGVVALANTGSPDSSDCQFFITDAPTTWLNGGYMIIGQVVSGWNVLNQIINLPTNPSNNDPLNAPILQSVTIFQSVSAATVTLQTDSTFTSPANVTITLTNASGDTTQQTIEVVPQSQLPTLITSVPISQQTVAPGDTGTVQAQFTMSSDISGMTLTLSAQSSQSTATVSIDPSTQVVTITAPSGFSGLFLVQVTATATGEGGFWADPLPVSATFYVLSQSPTDPPLESNTIDPAGGEVYQTIPYGNYVLAAAGASGVLVYDVTNPDNPTEVGSYATGGTAQDIAIVGQTAFVADGSGGLVALDIADPTNITLDGTVATASAAVGVAVDPTTDIAYVADGGAGVAEVDVSDPANMTVLQNIQQFPSGFSITSAQGIALNGSNIFVADSGGGVAILGIADPANVTITYLLGTYQDPVGLDIVGNTLYVADTYLIAYDITNPASPSMLGYLYLTSVSQVSVVNGMAMVGTSSGLSIVDVTDPTNMTLVYSFTGTGFIGDSSVVGDQLVVAGGPDGLLMFQNTLQGGGPTSSVTALPAYSPLTFTVSWSGQDGMGGTGIASYDVYVSDDGGTATLWQSATTATAASFTGVDGHTYSFTVLATDNAGIQQSQASAAVTTTVDGVAPTSGMGPLPTYSTANFTVTWSGQDSGSGVASYDVYVSDNGGTATLWQNATTATSAVFTGLDGHTYSFTVLATDNAGNAQTAASPAVTTLVDGVTPTSSMGPLPAYSSPGFTVSWTGQDNSGGSGLAGFDVYVSDNGATATLWQNATTATSAVFTGVDGHTYAFTVLATDNAGNQSQASAAVTTAVWPTGTKTLKKGTTSWTFTDFAGSQETVTYTGPGQALVERWEETDGDGDVRNITITGDNGTGTLTITTTGAGQAAITTVEDIQVVGSAFGGITAKTTNLLATGGVTVGGTLGTLAMGSTTADNSVSIGGTAASTTKTAITFGQVQGLSITSLSPIASLTCIDWLDPAGAADLITAPSLGTLTVTGKAANAALHQSAIIGNFQASLTLQGVAGSTLPVLTSASIAGVVTGTTIDATGYLGAIKAVSWTGGSITATGTAGITTTGGDLSTSLTLSGVGVASTAKTLGPVKSAGTIDGTWTVTGATGAMSAVSIPSTWNGAFSGNILSLTVAQNDSGQLQAGSLSGFTVSGNLTGTITLTGQAGVAKTLGTTKIVGTITGNPWQIGGNVGAVTVGNVSNWGIGGYNPGVLTPLGSIASLTAGTVSDTTITSAGFLGAIKAVSWIGGGITATGTTSITTTGGDFNTTLTLSGVGVAATAKTLGLATSAGDFDGAWNVTGATGAMKASSIPTTWNGTFSGNITSLTVAHNAYGQLQAASVGTMTVKGNYGDGTNGDTTLNLTMPLSGTKTALTSLSVTGSMNNVAVTSLANLGTITATGGASNSTIDSTGYLGAIKGVSWIGGSITAAGTAGVTTTGGDFNAGMTLSGAGLAATAKTLGLVSCAGALNGTWSVTGATGALTAASILTTWSGTFSGNIASLTVSQNATGQLEAGSITTMTVKGNYGDGTSGDTTLKLTEPLNTKTALGTLNVTGWMQGVNITSLDNLGAITAGGMNGSNVYAGVLDVDAALTPIGSIDDTVLSQANIASVTVKGITGAAASYVNTVLAGWNMGTLKLNMIQTDNGGTPFGVAANTIKSYTAQIGAKPYTWTLGGIVVWPNDTSASNGDYEVLQVV